MAIDRKPLPVTPEECMAEMEEVGIEIADVEQQLTLAKANRFIKGEYADPEWYGKTERSLRIKKIRRQSLQNWLGVLNRQEKINAQKRLERLFMDSARAILDTETWDKIMQLTLKKVELHETEVAHES